MKLLRGGLVICLLFLTVAASSNANAAGRRKAKDCYDTAMTQSALDACAGQHNQDAKDKLAKVYDEVLKEYAGDTVFIKALKVSQKAWVAYKKAQMKMMFPHSDEPMYYGTVFPMCEAQYDESLTKARTAQLMRWLKGSEEGDVCAGSIKYKPNAKFVPTPPLEVHSPNATTACHASKESSGGHN